MILKVIYKFKNLKESNKRDLDNLCIESNQEVDKLSKHWSLRQWEKFIQAIIFAKIEDSLVVTIPNPIHLPLNVVRQLIKKMRMERNIEKWLDEHDIKDYDKNYEVV